MFVCVCVCIFFNSCQTNVGTVDAVLGTVLSYLHVIIIGRVVTYYVSSSTTIIKKMATDAYCHLQGTFWKIFLLRMTAQAKKGPSLHFEKMSLRNEVLII